MIGLTSLHLASVNIGNGARSFKVERLSPPPLKRSLDRALAPRGGPALPPATGGTVARPGPLGSPPTPARISHPSAPHRCSTLNDYIERWWVGLEATSLQTGPFHSRFVPCSKPCDQQNGATRIDESLEGTCVLAFLACRSLIPTLCDRGARFASMAQVLRSQSNPDRPACAVSSHALRCAALSWA